MKAKDKAKELYNKFLPYTEIDVFSNETEKENTKQCALIAVDEMLKTTISPKRRDLVMLVSGMVFPPNYAEYWEEVKQEINNL